ncbi:uncharacterized protein STEHIDRAFT_169253 [Stereum hirsutum FP-91666 SS1]|uniref:uncharacterized protein n=1 Tax=Stereum hirsutum (strain FP-91666) TaxID=721885 RepID=UPI0004449405|nr:uncharacterized protein STEHIDRAFT_169253 [Stereum hirsutum FP-91666 SS1]EIM85253.1 hypothetical protein STEHIDRAFT_169253 [Stereum hirsutum FP-91666 SS1]
MLSRLQTASLIVLGCTLGLVLASMVSNLWATSHQVVDPAFHTAPRSISSHWNIGPLRPVALFVEDTLHYQLDTEEGIQQWAQLVPSDGGKIFTTSGEQPQTISMFHQLRCLDIIRAAIVISHTRIETGERPRGNVTYGLVRHCMNYLRQMMLCRSDLHLENVRDPVGPHAVEMAVMHVCEDWRVVYAAADAK